MKIQTKHWIILLLFLLTLAVYDDVWRFGFINMDDDIFVYNNPYMKDGLSFRALKWMFLADLTFDSSYADYWQPITFLIRSIVIQFFGTEPFFHHGFNVIIHAMNAVLLFLIFLRTTKSIWKSAFLAAAFAAHPLQVESVCWVTNLKGLLSVFFAFLSVWFYVSFVRKKKNVYLNISILCMALGAMSKPNILMLPVLLLILDVWPLERAHLQLSNWKNWQRLILEKKFFFIVTALSVSISVLAKSTIIRNLVFTSQIWTAPTNFVYFIWKALYPVQFAISSPFQSEPHLIEALGALGLIMWLSVLSVREFKKMPYFFAGWFWFLFMFIPIIFNTPEDRQGYFPVVGLFLMASFGVPDLIGKARYSKSLLFAISIFFLGWYAVAAKFQISYWKDSDTLFRQALAANPNNARAYNNLASHLATEGRIEEAIEYYTKALWLTPGHAKTHNNLAIVLANEGKSGVAKFHFEAAIQADPMMAEAYINLAGLLISEEKYEEGIRLLRRGLQIDPESHSGWNSLGSAYVRKGEFEKSIPYFLKAIEINSAYSPAHHDYGLALAKLGRMKEAIREFTEAIRLYPNYASAHNKLGVALALEGNFDEAEFHLKEALRLDPLSKDAEQNLNLLEKQRSGKLKKPELVIDDR